MGGFILGVGVSRFHVGVILEHPTARWTGWAGLPGMRLSGGGFLFGSYICADVVNLGSCIARPSRGIVRSNLLWENRPNSTIRE